MTITMYICDWCGERETRTGLEGNIHPFVLPVRYGDAAMTPCYSVMLCHECTLPIVEAVAKRRAERDKIEIAHKAADERNRKAWWGGRDEAGMR